MDIGKKILLTVSCFTLTSQSFGAELELVSQSSTDFRMLLFGFCAVVSVIVFSVLFYSTIYHRKSAYFAQSNFHKKLSTEVLWILLPIAMLIAMAIPSAVNVVGLDVLGQLKEQAYAVLSGNRKEKIAGNNAPPL